MADELRHAYQRSMVADRDHIDDDTWERLATGELSPREREAVFDHVTSCAECAAVYRALHQLAEEAHTVDAAALASPAHRGTVVRWRPRRTVAVIAALAATIAAVLIVRPFVGGGLSPTTGVRSGTVDAVPVLVAPTGTVNASHIELRWRAVDGADSYVVEVLDARGEPVWTSPETTGRSVEWPEEIEVEPGRLYWRVTARFPDGSETRSDLEAFAVVTRNPR